MTPRGVDLSREEVRERWRLVQAYTRDGLSTTQIAVRMGISARTVTRLRTRRPARATASGGAA